MIDGEADLTDIYAALDAMTDEIRGMRRYTSELCGYLRDFILMDIQRGSE